MACNFEVGDADRRLNMSRDVLRQVSFRVVVRDELEGGCIYCCWRSDLCYAGVVDFGRYWLEAWRVDYLLVSLSDEAIKVPIFHF